MVFSDTLSATVSNTGDGASASTTLRYYRSSDATISSSDTEVGTDAVGALAASGTSDESVGLTAPSSADTYYYGACVDAVTGESSTTNNCSAAVQVTVTEPPSQAASVEVTAPQEWAPVGGTVRYSARVLNSDSVEVSGYSISWSSSDTEKATVDANGLVTAIAIGEATITATAGETSGAAAARSVGSDSGTTMSPARELSCSLGMDVVTPVARIVFSPDSLSFDEVGAWETVTATSMTRTTTTCGPRTGAGVPQTLKWLKCTRGDSRPRLRPGYNRLEREPPRDP
ncbi:MAG: Ig-like domain-containing protein [Gemmatimonadetes bacterium]|nr:Ig-like domain-containing protein [Gemmatimonadota bacterium]